MRGSLSGMKDLKQTVEKSSGEEEPYINEPNNYGLQVTELESLYKATLAADKSGLQISIHAIGDKANDLILDLYKSLVSVNGDRDRRFRVEHAQHLALGTPIQFGEQGIIASVQPEHLLVDAASAIEKLGIERAQNGSYLLKSLLANKAPLAFGSDWPVADINPLAGIRAAMKRIPPGWENSWISSECISLEDALNAWQISVIFLTEHIPTRRRRAEVLPYFQRFSIAELFLPYVVSDVFPCRYTISAATACFLDHDLGSLSPGKLADFVVLSADSWDVFAAEGSASIEATYVGGERAYP